MKRYESRAAAAILLGSVIWFSACSSSARAAAAADDPAVVSAAQQLENGQVDAAVKALSDIASKPGASAGAYHYLAQAYLAADKPDDAVKAADNAVKASDSSSAGFASENLLAGAACIADFSYSNNAYRAKAATQSGVLTSDSALKTHETKNGGTETDLGDRQAVTDASDMQIGYKDEMTHESELLRKAEGYLKAALKADPTIGSAHDQLGLIYLAQQNKSKDARREFNQELTTNGPRSEAYYHLGQLDEVDGDYSAATRDLLQAVRYEPDNAGAYQELAGVYKHQKLGARQSWATGMAQAFQGQYDAATASFGSAGSSDPDAARGIALVAFLKGDTETALTGIGKVVASNPTNADALLLQGDVQLKAGKIDDSLTSYTQALAVDPTSDQAMVGQGIVYDAQGKRDKAIAAYQAALKQNPNNATALLNLAAASHDQHDDKSAAACLTDYLERYPMASNEIDVRGLLQTISSS